MLLCVVRGRPPSSRLNRTAGAHGHLPTFIRTSAAAIPAGTTAANSTTHALVVSLSMPSRVETAKRVASTLRASGWRTDAAAAPPDDLRALVIEAADGGADVVVAVGGDGTIGIVAGALVGRSARLGVVPAGTGNLVASNLGIPPREPAATRALISGISRWIDLGHVEVGGTASEFVVACGVGFDAIVMSRTARLRKRHLGKLSYFVTAMDLSRHIANVPMEITIDGVRRQTEAAQVFIANMGAMTSWLRPSRPVVPDDGLLDVFVIRAANPISALLAGRDALRSSALGEHPNGRVFRALAREVRVDARPSQLAEVDGDTVGRTPVRVSVMPRAVAVIVPPDRAPLSPRDRS
jgi:diacylglycerol kinase (ATP)